MATPQGSWHERSFFGLHYDLHPNAQDTILGLAATPEHIRAELEKVKPDFVQYDCKGHPGYAGYPTKVGTPSPGIKKDALKVWREVTREIGIPLSIHYSGTWDNVAVEQHPEWGRRKADGSLYGHLVCANRPYVDERMIPMFYEVIEWYDIDGIWVDGDNWAARPCWCEVCRRLFTEETGIAQVPEKAQDPHWRDWLAFQRRSFERYVTRYVEAVHARKPTCLVCTNWGYTVRQPEEIGAPVDWLSGDFPPAFGLEVTELEARFMDSRGKTWDLMAWTFFRVGDGPWTMKSPAHLQQEAAVVIANGGRLFLYDRPQRNGHLIGWHQDLEAQVGRFVRRRQVLCQDTMSVPQVALLHSASHYYAHNVPLFNTGQATKPLEGALQALLEHRYHVDVVNEDMLRRRMKEYRLIVVAEQTHLPRELMDELSAYVRQGGRLLVTGDHVVRDFGTLLGVEPNGEPQNGTFYVPAEGGAVPIPGPWQLVDGTGLRTLAPLLSGQEPSLDRTGHPAATVTRVGRGRVAAVYGPLFRAYGTLHYPQLRSFAGEALRAVAGKQMVELKGPTHVDLSLRRKGKRSAPSEQETLIVHLVNRGASPPLSPTHAAVEAVPLVGPLELRIEWPTEPRRVTLVPDRKGLTWAWEKGTIRARIEALHIHSAVVVE